jgi:hypothetical protein
MPRQQAAIDRRKLAPPAPHPTRTPKDAGRPLLGIIAGVLAALLLQVARQHIGAEAQRLGLVDHLLVHAWLGAAHNDVMLFRVNLRVEPGIADQIDDPELCLLLAHVELVGKHRDVDALVNATIRLKDEQARTLDELILQRLQKVVRAQQALALAQLLLSAVEVIVDQQALDKLSDWIAIRIVLLLDDANQILEHVSSPWVRDNGRCEIAQNMRTVRLNCLHIPLREEKINNFVAVVRVCGHFGLEENEQAPMYQPSALLQLLQRIVELLRPKGVVSLRTWFNDKINIPGYL